MFRSRSLANRNNPFRNRLPWFINLNEPCQNPVFCQHAARSVIETICNTLLVGAKFISRKRTVSKPVYYRYSMFANQNNPNQNRIHFRNVNPSGTNRCETFLVHDMFSSNSLNPEPSTCYQCKNEQKDLFTLFIIPFLKCCVVFLYQLLSFFS